MVNGTQSSHNTVSTLVSECSFKSRYSWALECKLFWTIHIQKLSKHIALLFFFCRHKHSTYFLFSTHLIHELVKFTPINTKKLNYRGIPSYALDHLQSYGNFVEIVNDQKSIMNLPYYPAWTISGFSSQQMSPVLFFSWLPMAQEDASFSLLKKMSTALTQPHQFFTAEQQP